MQEDISTLLKEQNDLLYEQNKLLSERNRLLKKIIEELGYLVVRM